ncbi:MAG TPA: hypothetical protein VFQ68_15030 [Streptosporangiaceae bacterium]|nr:hypothetical protein [Streptosporangiaceae bacterium]
MREMPDPGRDNDTVSPAPARQARAAAITAEITARPAAVNSALPGPAAGQMCTVIQDEDGGVIHGEDVRVRERPRRR